MVALEDLLQPTMDEIDAIHSGGAQSVGAPAGFAELEEVTTGLHGGPDDHLRGQMSPSGRYSHAKSLRLYG
jgi:replicative DNA helicase